MAKASERIYLTLNNRDQIFVDITFKIKYRRKKIFIKNEEKRDNGTLDEILEGYTTAKNIPIKSNMVISKTMSDFLREQNTYLNDDSYFFIQRKGKIIKQIDKNLKVNIAGIKDGDEIILIDDLEIKNKLDNQIELNQIKTISLSFSTNRSLISNDFSNILKGFLKPRVNKSKIELIEKQPRNVKKKKKITYILLGVFTFLVLGLIGLGVYLYLEKSKEREAELETEDLVINIKYIPNTVYKYNFNKKILMKAEGASIKEEESTKEILQGSDFFLLIKSENNEENKVNHTSKKWYSGYLAILNLSYINDTGTTEIIYDKYLNNIINQKNSSKENEKRELIDSVGNATFVKIEFYENGEIRNIYYPKDVFTLTNMMYMNEYTKLIIPKISSDLYTDSINDSLNTLLNSSIEDSEDDDEDENYYPGDMNDSFIYNDTFNDSLSDNDTINETENNIDNLRYLEEKKKKSNKPKMKKKYYRVLSPNISEGIELKIEEYLTVPIEEENVNCDLREKNDCTDCSSPNLTQFSTGNVKSDEVNLDNSQINKTMHTTINKDGILESAVEIERLIMNNDKDANEEDLNDLKAKGELYNEDNQLSMSDANKEQYNNNITFGLDSIFIDTINQANLTGYFTNDKISKILFRYFDTFIYELYNETSYNEYLTSLIEDKIIKENDPDDSIVSVPTEEVKEENNIRRMEGSGNTYYGMKNTVNEKDLYKYNLLGLKMQKKIYNEMIPSTGITESYFVMTFGNINKKIKASEQKSNMHIILDRKNQMIFNLMQLLDTSNSDLKQKNKKTSEIILNLEDNLLEMIKEYDFTDMFRDCLADVNSKLNSFTGDIFNDLIKLVIETYENYTIIIKDVDNGKYEVFQKIREVTKEEYLQYINTMINNLESFSNATLLFLERIEEEIDKAEKFEKMDFLYDILDNIYECKLILTQFNKNLYKAIEKGILSFKTDINDFKESIIGDLLYITDFLSMNINKNNLLKQAYDEEERNEMTIKLRNFRNMVQYILDKLMININEDYDEEMSLSNSNSIKTTSEEKAKEHLNQITQNSDEVIVKIKKKLDNIDLFDLYTENLDFINNANNKTMIEFIELMNKDFMKKLINLEPEYLNKNNDIYKKKEDLFKISKSIADDIKKEINEINEHIKEYSKNFKEKNIFNMQYNLYKINNLFLENETEYLYNELIKAFNYTIVMHKKRIDYNYQLAYNYLNELRGPKNDKKDKLFIGTGLIQKYNNFISKFSQYVYLANSEEVYNNFESNYIRIRKEIFDFLNNTLSKIQKYYFENDIYEEDFFFINRINLGLNTTFDKINKFFTDDKFYLLKSQFLTYALDEIQKYNDKKSRDLVNLYNFITGGQGVKDTGADYYYKKKNIINKIFGGGKDKHIWLSSTNNIYRVNIDLSHTKNYLNNITDHLIKNHTNKINEFLSNYANCTQELYENLYNYVENKINYHNNTKILFNNYENIYKDLIDSNSNYGLLDKLYNKITNEKLIYINNIKNNVNNLVDEYLNSYYMKDYLKFLEYPQEIIFKVKQYRNELKDTLNNITNKINYMYRNRITNILHSTNIFIEDLINLDYNFILVDINNRDIIDEYIISKKQYISDNFENYLNNLNNLSNKIYNITEQNNYLNLNNENFVFTDTNFNESISSTLQKLESFVSNLEDLINKNFTYQICDNDNKCETYQNKSSLTNYKYNYNIVKIRTGLNYTKTALENIMNIFDELNYEELFNMEKYNDIEHLLNDKNIFNIYNSTLSKIKEINRTTNSLLEEQHEYFYSDIVDLYKFDNDYYPFLKKYEQLLKMNNEPYNLYCANIVKSKFNNIDEILKRFNDTLYQQKDEYTIYNIDKNNTFYNDFEEFLYQINNTFEIFKSNILDLNKNPFFLNTFRNLIFNNNQIPKINYYKNKINEIGKNHDYRLLNMTLDLGEIIGNLLKKGYEEHEFSYVFEYMEIYDTYLDNFLQNLTEYISIIGNDYMQKFKNIYNEFLENFYKDNTSYINQQYVDDLKENYTYCLNYSINILDEAKIEDEINYQKYLEYLEYLNYTSNISNISSDNTSDIEEVVFINKTKIILYCHNNDYYNYSVKYYYDFEEIYKNKLNGTLNELSNINLTDLEKTLLYNYLEDNIEEYQLENYTQENKAFEDLNYNYLSYDDMVTYINYTQNNIYYDYLYDLLSNSFKPSYTNYINNYLISPLIDNITSFINNYAEIHLDYLMSKINDEFDYYYLLLNNTKELGVNSKYSLSTLYDDVEKKINNSIYFTITEYALFYIDKFYRTNKYTFSNNYITYYANKLNAYKLDICQLNEVIDEIMYDGNFNKTLNNISNELMTKLVFNKMKDAINKLINTKFSQIYSRLKDLKINMNNILSKIKQNEDNEAINIIINEYRVILQNQNNQFIFKVSKLPFNELYSFIKYVLEPPILLIKNEYNSIEGQILGEVVEVINGFPNFKEEIKNKLNIEGAREFIKVIFNETLDSLLKYQNDLSEDIDTYINKLIHYTFINGLDYYNEPCTDSSFCAIKINEIKNQNKRRRLQNSPRKRRLGKIIRNKNKVLNLTEINKKKNKNVNLRKLSTFDSTMGSLSQDDVIPLLLNIEETIYELNESYITNFDKNANIKLANFISKVNGTYLVRLDRTIATSISQFAPILSKESFKNLSDNMYREYNRLADYLHNATNLLQEDMFELIAKLKNTSIFLEEINNYSYDKIIGYYNILTQLIDSKYKMISGENIEDEEEEEEADPDYEHEDIKDSDMKKFNKKFKECLKNNKKIFTEALDITEKFKVETEGVLKDLFTKDKKEEKKEEKEGEEEEDDDDDMSSELSLVIDRNGFVSLGYKFAKEITLLAVKVPIPPFIMLLPTFPILQMRIVPKISFELGFKIGAEIMLTKKDQDLSVFFDVSASAEVSINLEIGVYIPQFPTAIEISLAVGLRGILGSGLVGMKIELFLTNPRIKVNLYMEFKALEFTFFILFRVKVDIVITKFDFQFYIMNERLFDGFGYSNSMEIVYELFNFASLSVKQTQEVTNGVKN